MKKGKIKVSTGGLIVGKWEPNFKLSKAEEVIMAVGREIPTIGYKILQRKVLHLLEY